MTDTLKETLGFQAEVTQVLRLVINSLYSNKEIFLRELISNAADACDKLRFLALADSALYENDGELTIRLIVDKDNHTLTLRDNGIGMSREEVVTNLGTIAHSGTKQFLERLTGDQAKDAQLIGQFGVGFYSSFIVADQVVVKTRRAGQSAEDGVLWTSKGEGEYSIESISKAERGTDIILHLKSDDLEFLDEWRLRSLITKYADHINWPVQLAKPPKTEEESSKDDLVLPDHIKAERAASIEWETINKASALWTRPKTELSESDYHSFYQHISHDFEPPLMWSHHKVEGNLEYTALLYLPKRAPFDLWERDSKSGLKLYVKRVFIMENADQLLPRYLRFVRGIIDSNDLPLNVSRELLQNNKVIEKIRAGATKKVLSLLDTLAKDESEKYADFWKQFGLVLKEGLGEDYANKDALAKLLRFSSTHDDQPTQKVSLADYVSRLKEGQDKIYYLTADSFAAAKNSPHLELFRKKGVEVLLLTDRIDEWLVAHLPEFEGKSLQSVAKGAVDISNFASEEEKAQQQQAETELSALLPRIKTALEDRIGEARLSNRLTDSPACLVVDEHAMSAHLQRLLKEAGQAFTPNKPHLEINPQHALIRRLNQEQDNDRFNDLVHVLFDQALLAEGGALENPAHFVQRLNKLLLELSA